MKKLVFVLIILTNLVIGCTPEEKPECIADADCAAATCCHASDCAAKINAPNCEGVICSMECTPYTMDCGQGRCVCENKKCIAKIS